MTSCGDLCSCVAGGEGVHVGEDGGFGAVVAELGLVLALDDGGRWRGCRRRRGGRGRRGGSSGRGGGREALRPFVDSGNPRLHGGARRTSLSGSWDMAKGLLAFPSHLALGIAEERPPPFSNHKSLHGDIEPFKLPELRQPRLRLRRTEQRLCRGNRAMVLDQKQKVDGSIVQAGSNTVDVFHFLVKLVVNPSRRRLPPPGADCSVIRARRSIAHRATKLFIIHASP